VGQLLVLELVLGLVMVLIGFIRSDSLAVQDDTPKWVVKTVAESTSCGSGDSVYQLLSERQSDPEYVDYVILDPRSVVDASRAREWRILRDPKTEARGHCND
jgi:hypothetical protein